MVSCLKGFFLTNKNKFSFIINAVETLALKGYLKLVYIEIC